MRVKFLRNQRVGAQRYRAGDVAELGADEATTLLQLGLVEAVKATKETAVSPSGRKRATKRSKREGK